MVACLSFLESTKHNEKQIYVEELDFFLRTGLFEVVCIISLKCVMEIPCFLLT